MNLVFFFFILLKGVFISIEEQAEKIQRKVEKLKKNIDFWWGEGDLSAEEYNLLNEKLKKFEGHCTAVKENKADKYNWRDTHYTAEDFIQVLVEVFLFPYVGLILRPPVVSRNGMILREGSKDVKSVSRVLRLYSSI